MPDLTMEDHRMLIARVASHHDRDAFQSLFLHFGPRVKSVMVKAGADPDLAEDLVQDVMMTVWRKAGLYAPERGAVSTWVYTIARNARVDRLRRASSQPYRDLEGLDLASEDADGEDEAFASQRAEHVAKVLDELPDEQRRIIEYAFIHDMAQSEIAAKLDLPLGTVKSRMRLAYMKLKGKLEVLK
ncbi:sigma-70 family RNA polymerase sigma factor [Breoghania sp. L-A4]|uniref:sigma-70 family RNA polymerase sigma factor n=1 Tax=Breoghania sp. L-A4 TaxID=2304600 RepID=UPI0013C2CB25|nr:sigma-70 family RNA polymerase sigma factor [Breoghania sp. L-A4]